MDKALAGSLPIAAATTAAAADSAVSRRQASEPSWRESREFSVNIIDSLVQHIAVLDADGVIVTVNQAWRDFARDNSAAGSARESIGLNYLKICRAASADEFGGQVSAVLAGISEVLAGSRAEFSLEYPCSSATEERWFIMHVTPLRGGSQGAVVAHENITPRKQAEHAVRESEARFSAFFEHAMVGMATTSLEKGWLLVNPALCAILGYSRQELTAKTWAELTHPDDLAADVANFDRLLRDETDHYAMEKRFIRPDGAVIHAFIAVRAVRHGDRRIDFFAAIVEDISERKRADEAIRSAQRLMQQFIDHLPGTAFVKDENLRVLLANKAFQNILGIDPAMMIGKTNSELFPGDFGKKLEADDRRVLNSGQRTTLQEDFEGRFFETSKFVIEGEAGKRLLGGITLDVTQRQKTSARQDALLRISELGGTLAESDFLEQGIEMIARLTVSQFGFIHFVDDDQHFIEQACPNAGTVGGLRLPIEEAGTWADCVRDKKIMVFNAPADAHASRGLPPVLAPFKRLIAASVIEEGQVRMIVGVGNKASDYDDYDCVTAQMLGNDIWRIVRRVRAETALQQKLAELTVLNARLDETNNKLLQSEKLASIGQLAAGVAHEINNPIGYVTSNLNSLAGYVNDLLAIDEAYQEIDERFGDAMPQAFERAHQLKAQAGYRFIIDDIQHLIDESRQGLDRVRKIVQDLKDFSRIGATGWQWVNLHDGLESTLNIVWNEIKYKAKVERDYGELPETYCIPAQINQVFMNLLTNAAQSITTAGRLVLRSRCEGESVWIEVEDNGSGIAAENLERIFEPFYTTKPIGQGTGLGLSLSWGIVQRHHGKIEVHSIPGQGTTFRVTLPIVPHSESDDKAGS